MKIEMIPIGKENKISREELMSILKINSINEFKKVIEELKQDNIILFEDGYYRPDKKEEYEEVIEKCKLKTDNMKKIIKLAKIEMEKL